MPPPAVAAPRDRTIQRRGARTQSRGNLSSRLGLRFEKSRIAKTRVRPGRDVIVVVGLARRRRGRSDKRARRFDRRDRFQTAGGIQGKHFQGVKVDRVGVGG